jgi:hypothetical protein
MAVTDMNGAMTSRAAAGHTKTITTQGHRRPEDTRGDRESRETPEGPGGIVPLRKGGPKRHREPGGPECKHGGIGAGRKARGTQQT